MHQNHNFAKQFDYLVIGAGISGLQSLEILSRSTTSVLGLQSQGIAAGRVLSESVVSLPGAKKLDWIKENQNKLKNVFVQKGATWIQTRHKFLLQVCKQFELELREQNTQGDNLYLYQDKSISASQLAANPKFGLQLKTFVRQIDHLAKLYEKYVLSSNKDKVRSNRMLAEYDTKIVSQFLQENIHSVQARQLVETFLQHTECVSCDENSMHQVLTKSARSNDIGILREFLGDYSDEGHEPSYLLNNGTYAIIQKFVQVLQKRLKAPIQEIILFNQKVLTIDNKRDDFCVVTTLNSQTNKSSKFKAKKIICTVPLSVIRSITFTNISKSKRFILDNQLRTTCMKSFIIVKKPFWRRIASGDAIFSSQYLVNMCHDISPIDLSCGIMVFFHNGKKFDEWESHFKNEANQYEAKKKYIIDLTCKLFRVTEQEKKQYLDDCLFYISSFMDNPNIRSGFQSCTSPGTYTSILKLGQGIQAFYRDENNVFFVGSEFSSEFASYMEGVVRVAREKCFKLIGRQDDLFSSEKNKDKYQSSTNLTAMRARL